MMLAQDTSHESGNEAGEELHEIEPNPQGIASELVDRIALPMAPPAAHLQVMLPFLMRGRECETVSDEYKTQTISGRWFMATVEP